MKREKLVLAYSGGLDTSVLVHWLTSEGYDVIALCLDLGQQVEDLEAIRDKGHKVGAVEVLLENVQEEFVGLCGSGDSVECDLRGYLLVRDLTSQTIDCKETN